jgi:prepilin-type N-terminal cleavage/methylation domain-containing protein
MFVFMSTRKGFTLIELIVVTAIVLVIVGAVVPVGISFYRSQVVDETAHDVLAVLRRAQMLATLQKNDSPFGVAILADRFVLFQGASYAARVQSEDTETFLSSIVALSGASEIVFSKMAGETATPGAITISSGNDSITLYVASIGKIEIQ